MNDNTRQCPKGIIDLFDEVTCPPETSRVNDFVVDINDSFVPCFVLPSGGRIYPQFSELAPESLDK